MVYIYILKLKNNKYYVGKTKNPKFRLKQHFDAHGSAWTKKYPPIKIIKVIKNCDGYDEDKYVKMLMKKYGFNNVRGGTYVQTCDLDIVTINFIKKELYMANDLCSRCGRRFHFASNCFASYDIYSDKLPKNKRFRCTICNGLHYTIYCPKRKRSKKPFSEYAFDSDSDSNNENIV